MATKLNNHSQLDAARMVSFAGATMGNCAMVVRPRNGSRLRPFAHADSVLKWIRAEPVVSGACTDQEMHEWLSMHPERERDPQPVLSAAFFDRAIIRGLFHVFDETNGPFTVEVVNMMPRAQHDHEAVLLAAMLRISRGGVILMLMSFIPSGCEGHLPKYHEMGFDTLLPRPLLTNTPAAS